MPLAIACIVGPRAPAYGAEAPVLARGLHAADVFALAAAAEQSGDTATARRLLETLAHDPDLSFRTEARFRLAQLLERQGKNAQALTAYRALLDEKPNAAAVRMALARLLAITGDDVGAQRELRRAAAAGLPDDVARLADQFANALRSRRRFGATLELAIAPDSNINRATRATAIDTVIAPVPIPLDPAARPRSGLGLVVATQLFGRSDLGGQSILTRLSGRADLYRERRFDDVIATISSGPELRDRRTRFSPAAVLSRRWYGGRAYSFGYGFSLDAVRTLDARSQLEIEGSVIATGYAVNRRQNGLTVALSIAFDRALSPRLSTRFRLTADRQGAVDPGFRTTSVGATMLLARQVGHQTLFVEAGLARSLADARLFPFPAARRDTIASFTAGALLRRFEYRGFAPLVRATATATSSTLALYRYNRTRVEFGLSREF